MVIKQSKILEIRVLGFCLYKEEYVSKLSAR